MILATPPHRRRQDRDSPAAWRAPGERAAHRGRGGISSTRSAALRIDSSVTSADAAVQGVTGSRRSVIAPEDAAEELMLPAVGLRGPAMFLWMSRHKR